MKSTFFSLAIVLLIITSCGKQSADYKALKAQNDSLLNAKLSLQREVDGYFSAMNEIEQNIEKIKSTENLISIQPIGQELNDDQRTKINEDMLYLSEMLQANKEELARLKSKLKKSGFKSSELQRTISRLTKALDEESLKVTTLNTKLAEKDSLIVQLGTTVSDLSKDVEEISTVAKLHCFKPGYSFNWFVFSEKY